MRRVVSVILFVLGGWMLSSGVMMAWINLGHDIGLQLLMLGVFVGLSAPFLLLAIWASPGSRLRELGLTFLIAAGVGGGLALVLMLLLNDASFTKFMPPDQKMPELKFAPLPGIVSVLLVCSLGWLLYRRRPASVSDG